MNYNGDPSFPTADSICLLTRVYRVGTLPAQIERREWEGWLTDFLSSAKLLEVNARPLPLHSNSLGNEMPLARGRLPQSWGKFIVTGGEIKEVGNRLKALREGISISQVKMADAFSSARYRYENGQSKTPIKLLYRYADYSDVSLDYVFTWSVKSQCVTYEFKPKATLERGSAPLY